MHTQLVIMMFKIYLELGICDELCCFILSYDLFIRVIVESYKYC